EGLVVDGTGQPAYRADVAIRGERIVAIGSVEPGPGARVVDASAWVVAPGFIDLHTHSDLAILAPKTRSTLNYLTQGWTTTVMGNCGYGSVDARAYLAKIDARGAGTNVIHLVPHGSVRGRVLGFSGRKADAQDLDRMKTLVAAAMDAGAWGMSTG